MEFGKKEPMAVLNNNYQEKMETMMSRRQITSSRKLISFGIDTLKITSVMNRTSYERIVQYWDDLRDEYKTEPSVLTVQNAGELQGIKLIKGTIKDLTSYVYHFTLGDEFGMSNPIAHRLQIETRVNANDTNQVVFTVRLNPNRFNNTIDERLINVLINDLLPLMPNSRVSQIDFNYDIPVPFEGFKLSVGSGQGYDSFKERKSGKHYYARKFQTSNGYREIELYRKYEERLDHLLPDDSYITVQEAEYYTYCDEPVELTRFEARVKKARGVTEFMKKPEWLLKGDIRYSYSNQAPYHTETGSMYVKHEGVSMRISIQNLLVKALKEMPEKILALPYVTPRMVGLN